jgi:hypothetical protein
VTNDLALYNAARVHIQTGDMLLWKSHSLLGALIRYFSRKPENHASQAERLVGMAGVRLFTIEALEDGVNPNYLSTRLQNFSGQVYWYALCDQWDKYDIRLEIERRLWSQVGTRYDYPSLFVNAIRHVEADDSLLFCSEAVFLALGFKGKAPTPGELPGLKIFKDPVRIL